MDFSSPSSGITVDDTRRQCHVGLFMSRQQNFWCSQSFSFSATLNVSHRLDLSSGIYKALRE